MSQTQGYQSETLDATISKTIAELSEIRSRSEQTDNRLSSAFYKGTLLFLRHGKQALLSAVLDTCARLRVRDVEGMLTWSTAGNLIFRRMEGLSLPVVTDKAQAIYNFVGHKKSGASLFTLITQYQSAKREQAKVTKAAASAALAEADLVFAAKAMEQAIIATGKKFPKHTGFFVHMLNCLHQYNGKG